MTTPGGNRPRRDAALKALIALSALSLLALLWSFELASTRTERVMAQGDAEADVANLALSVDWQLDRQLQSIDHLMQDAAAQWRADAGQLDPAGWRRPVAKLHDPSLALFLVNAQGRVVSSTRREMLGADFAQRRIFQATRDSPRSGLSVVPSINWRTTGRWDIELSRRLEDADGRFGGIVVAAYDPWSLTNVLEQVDLGPRGLIALVGDDGAIRALVSPYEVPAGEDIAGSAMFRASRDLPRGVWTGASAPDGVVRIHAFRRLADQDLTIVIGIDRSVALRAAALWENTARWFALASTAAILLLAGGLGRALAGMRSRADQFAADRVRLQAAHAEAERETARAEAKAAQLQAVLSGMSDGVMLLDDELCLGLWNDRFPLYSGVPAGLLRVGTPMMTMLRAQALAGEFGPPLSDAWVEAEVAQRMDALRAGRIAGAHERNRPGGRSIEFRRSVLPGGGLVTLYTDITARRQTEAARADARRIAAEAAEQKAEFVAVVSHEIRTPLNAVLGSLALLDQSVMSAPQRALADTAREAGSALLDLVNDVLEMSRMEAGRLQLRPASFELRQLLQGVQAMFRADAAARGIALTVEIDPALPPMLLADAGRLRQVLMNFVANAVKFADPGPVTIRAGFDRNGRGLLLGVRDCGPGIAAQDAKLLFRPFSRLGAQHAAGTGLGLAICARLIELMGGEVGVAAAGQGNEFWLTLPLDTARISPESGGAAGLGPELVTLRRRCRAAVLLVEDVPANGRITATLLRRAGHHVELAETGLAAVALARSRPFDIVFMDLAMPGISGIEAAALIRALPGPAVRVPIVALTATTAPQDRAGCTAAGIEFVLSKPAATVVLLDAIETLVMADAKPSASGPRPGPGRLPAEESGNLVDSGRLAELRDGLPPEVLAPLFAQCVTDIRERGAMLERDLAAGEAHRAGAAAHAIAGLAATYGFAGLERRMRRLMRAAQAGDIAQARDAGDAFDVDLAAAAETAQAFVARPPVPA